MQQALGRPIIRRTRIRLLTVVYLLPVALTSGCGHISAADRLIGTDAPPTTATYARLAEALDAHLRRDVLAKWYPACVDKAGGFHQNFARDWTRGADTNRFLVYQARQTWVAARAAMYDPALKDEYAAYALHGLDYLDKVMSDRECGGLYFRLGPDGRITKRFGAEKHAYGIAFAIYAGAAVYEATGQTRALEFAMATFEWFDDHAHDARHGGYFEALKRDGTPIRKAPRPGARDGISTPYGYKSMNGHIHLLEALTELYKAGPDPRARRRLEEMLAVVRDRIAVEPGALNYYFTPDWRAVPMHDSFGHDIETAFLMVEAADALGRPDDAPTWRVARSIVDHALAWGWDAKHGGFYYSGQAFAPAFERFKSWWTQAEGLNVLLLMHERYGAETDRYWKAFVKQLQFIWDHQIDHTRGGWYCRVTEDGGDLVSSADKATPWKAAYHNVRALMQTVRRLRHLAASSKES